MIGATNRKNDLDEYVSSSLDNNNSQVLFPRFKVRSVEKKYKFQKIVFCKALNCKNGVHIIIQFLKISFSK